MVVGVDVEEDGAKEWCFWGRNFGYREDLLVIFFFGLGGRKVFSGVRKEGECEASEGFV